jgi:6-phosphogluconolactonase
MNMKKILLIVALLSPALIFAQKENTAPKTFDLVVGTYTSGKSTGISVYRFYAETGRLAYLNHSEPVSNPSYLALSADSKFLYAVNENNKGEVSSFHFEPKTGKITFINKQSTLGAAPCYISVDKKRRNLFIANYSGGNIAVLPLEKDGSILPAVQSIRDPGRGPDKARQEKAHAHTAVLSPDEKYLLYTDLGTDKINITEYQGAKTNPLVPATPPFASVAAGAGPRHLAFSPNQRYLYAVSEMGGAVTAFKYDNGKLKQIQEITLSPDVVFGKAAAADIHISADGRFLYATNRGDANEISLFGINRQTGVLTFIERKATGGKVPRNFVIDPTGKFLLIANQDSDTIIVHGIDQTTGKLTGAVSRVAVGNPVCLKFAPAE